MSVSDISIKPERLGPYLINIADLVLDNHKASCSTEIARLILRIRSAIYLTSSTAGVCQC